jgi:hypothetical protein
MRLATIGFITFLSLPVFGKPAGGQSSPVTSVASDGAGGPHQQLRVVGRLNVNTATREQLSKVPGLDPTAVDAILQAREEDPIKDLAALPGLSDEARLHLKTDGESNFTRILQNPLTRIASK